MLSDTHIIAQLLVSLISVVLLFSGLSYSIRMMRHWTPDSRNEQQVSLERSAYLVSSVLFFTALIQLLSLILFLITINEYLPEVIKGAMCGVGSLGINPYGYPTLYLKMSAAIFLGAFLMLNHLDNREPGFPLTPIKYRLVPIITLFGIADFVLLLLYFYNIEPDVVATCCSVNFTASQAETLSFIQEGELLKWAFGFWVLSGLLQVLRYIRRLPALAESVNVMVFTVSGVYVLKFYFVKYIYGTPAHNCLFDVFFAHNQFSGFGIYGGYYLLLLSALFRFLTLSFSERFRKSTRPLLRVVYKLSLIGFVLTVLIPLIYRSVWNGTL